jgi:hypothetical protein
MVIILLNFSIVIILVFYGKIDINELITKMIIFIKFWITIFIIIFLPRRIIRKSRLFRCFCVLLIKKYPLVLYYRYAITNVVD